MASTLAAASAARSLASTALRTAASPAWGRPFHASSIAREAASSGSNTSDSALLDRIKSELKDAMRARNTAASTVLRSLLSEHQYALKQPQAQGQAQASLTTVLQKALAKRVEAAAQYRAATPQPREDLAQKEDDEAALIRTFLPEPYTSEELNGFIKRALDQVRGSGAAGASPQTDAKRLAGQVIKAVNASVDKARVTGAQISKAVTEMLKQS